MARADLDDAARALAAHERVGGGRVEAREPILVEARRPVAGGNAQELAPIGFDRLEERREARLGRREQGPQRRIIGRGGGARRSGTG